MFKQLDTAQIGKAEIQAKKIDGTAQHVRLDIRQQMIGVSFVLRIDELTAFRDYLNRAIFFAQGVEFIPEDTRVRVIDTGEIGTVQSVHDDGMHYVMLDGEEDYSQEEPGYHTGWASEFEPI